MIYAIPLHKTINKINIAVSPSSSEFSAIHIISDQSMHFIGTFPDDIYPIVYTENHSNNDKWHGHLFPTNVIKTKGD